MLEHPILLVNAWHQTRLEDGVLSWTRLVTDAGGQTLGFVRGKDDQNRSWLPWLRRQRFEVFETQDASLLMSLTRSWGFLRAWQIDDADDRHVGGVHTKTIVTSENEWVGFLDRDSAEAGRIVDANGAGLARFSRKNPAAIELIFTQESAVNPFLRMLLLGAVLTLDPTPRG